MSESLQESTQKVSDPAPKTAAPVEMSHQLSFKKRQESAHENRHCISTVEDGGPPSSLSELEKRSSFTSTIHHPRDSTGELPIALQQELATGKVLELIAPSPNYYKFLSGPGKRRDRRARRNQALVVTKHTTTLVEHDCFPTTTDDLAAHLNEKVVHSCWTILNWVHIRRTCSWDKGPSAACPVQRMPYRYLRRCNLGDYLRFDPKACDHCIIPRYPVTTNWEQRRYERYRAYLQRSNIWRKINKRMAEQWQPSCEDHNQRFELSFYQVPGRMDYYRCDILQFYHKLEGDNTGATTWEHMVSRHSMCCTSRGGEVPNTWVFTYRSDPVTCY
jgi:hypothetical protein